MSGGRYVEKEEAFPYGFPKYLPLRGRQSPRVYAIIPSTTTQSMRGCQCRNPTNTKRRPGDWSAFSELLSEVDLDVSTEDYRDAGCLFGGREQCGGQLCGY